jgi:hypothetical protein
MISRFYSHEDENTNKYFMDWKDTFAGHTKPTGGPPPVLLVGQPFFRVRGM